MINTRENWADALIQMQNILDTLQYMYPECSSMVDDALTHIHSMQKCNPNPRAVPREYAKNMLFLRKIILQLCSMFKCAPIDVLKLTQYDNYAITVLQSQLYLLTVALVSKKRAQRELYSMLAYNSKIGCLAAQDYIRVIHKYSIVRGAYMNSSVPNNVMYLIDFCGIADNSEQLRVPVQELLQHVMIQILQDYSIVFDIGKSFEYYLKFFNCIPDLQPLYVYYDNDSLDVDWWMFFDKFLDVIGDPEKMVPLLTRPSMIEYVQPALLGMLDQWTVMRLQLQRESQIDISHNIIGDIFHDVLLYTKLYKNFTDSMWAIDTIPSQMIWKLLEQLQIGEVYRLPYNRPSENIEQYVKRLDLQPAVLLLSDLFVATSIPGTLRHDVLVSNYTDSALNYYALYGDTPANVKAKYKNNMFGYLNDLIHLEEINNE